jgi:23S rRNA pseudouridine1911/1915/1917 synthase
MDKPDEKIRILIVGPDDGGTRLDKFLSTAAPDLSRMRLKTLILSAQVTLEPPDAAQVTLSEPSYRVKPGQRLHLTVPPPVDATPAPQAIPLVVTYEDDDLIVIDKPAGLVVHPAPGNPDRTLVNALLAHCGDSLSGVGGVRRPGIVHRLDKDTSGLIIAAKNDHAHHHLADQFARHSIDREYVALVWGAPRPPVGEIATNIGRDPRHRRKMAVVSAGGKHAVTRYRVDRPVGAIASIVRCKLETGRTHQIRVHLAHLGHPVVGDPLYGGHKPRKGMSSAGKQSLDAFNRQALHARLLGFDHPTSGEHLRFESGIPADILALIDCLE